MTASSLRSTSFPALLLTLAALLFLVNGCAEQTVTRVDSVPTTAEALADDTGVYYALPRTVLDLDVPVRKVTTHPSPFLTDLRGAAKELQDYLAASDQVAADEQQLERALGLIANPQADPRYAKLLMRLNRLGIELIRTPRTRFELGEIELNTRTEADPNQLYRVEVAGGLFVDREVTLDLTESGLLTVGQSRTRNNTIDLTVRAIEIAADIAAVTGLGKWPLLDLAITPVDKIYKFADETLTELETVKRQRREFVAGVGLREAPDRATLDRMLKELDAVESRLTSYFESRTVLEWTGRFSVVPDEIERDKNRNVLVLDFDPRFGITPPDPRGRIIAVPVPAAFRSERSQLSRSSALTISVDLDGNASRAVVETPKRHGFPYRIPQPATAVVRLGSEERIRARLNVAQLGTLAFLPRRVGGIENEVEFGLYPESGALRRLRTRAAGLEPDALERLGDAFTPLIERAVDLDSAMSELEAALGELGEIGDLRP